jgi:hypothetical protein
VVVTRRTLPPPPTPPHTLSLYIQQNAFPDQWPNRALILQVPTFVPPWGNSGKQCGTRLRDRPLQGEPFPCVCVPRAARTLFPGNVSGCRLSRLCAFPLECACMRERERMVQRKDLVTKYGFHHVCT